MKFYGFNLQKGAFVKNFFVPKGPEFPLPEESEEGELFVLTENDAGLYVHVLNNWYPLYTKTFNILSQHDTLSVLTHSHTGFSDIEDIENPVLSFDSATRIFSIDSVNPYSFIIQGIKHTISQSKQIQIPDQTGLYYISFQNDDLVFSTEKWDVKNHVPVARLLWNSENQQLISLSESRQLAVMPANLRSFIRGENVGYKNGLAISIVSSSGNGMSDEEAQFIIQEGDVFDNTVNIPIRNKGKGNQFTQKLTPVTETPVYYRHGMAGHWRKNQSTEFSIMNGNQNGMILFNQKIVDEWALTEVNDRDKIVMWLFATNNTQEPIIAIMGQNKVNDLNSPDVLSIGNLPLDNYKILYRVLYESKRNYSNSRKAKIIDIQDLRTMSNLQFSNHYLVP